MDKKPSIIIYSILLMGLTVFTFLDLQTSQYLYNPDSILSNVFKVIGEVPYYIMGMFSTAYLVVTVPNRKRSKIFFTVIEYIVTIALLFRVSLHLSGAINYHLELGFGTIGFMVLIDILMILSLVIAYLIKKKGNIEIITKLAYAE